MSQKFFRILPENINFPFVKYAKFPFVLSLIFIAVCSWSLLTKGLNYGVDFKGGTEVIVRLNSGPDVSEVRSVLTPAGYAEANVQSYGEPSQHEYIVRVQTESLQLKQHEAEIQKSMDAVSGKSGSAKIRYSEDRIYVVFEQPAAEAAIHEEFSKVLGQKLPVQSVSRFGGGNQNEYLVQFSGAGSKIVQALQQSFGKDQVVVLQTEEVGQKVGSELRMQAVGAVLISIILILGYIWFRFDFEFAPGAIIALIHDALAILGIFSIFGFQFDLSSIAAVLTIVGFSINDTIVTYDRVRENLRLQKNVHFSDIINRSINETLGRTILTSMTLFMACVILYFYGGEITKNFALALCVGILSGTYSTVFIAAPLTIYIREYTQKRSLR